MKTINVLLSFLILIAPFSSHAQEDNTFLSVEDYASTSMLLKEKPAEAPYKDESLILEFGSLKVKSAYIYANDSFPYDAYALKLKDFLRVESYINGLDISCDIGNTQLVSSCKEEIILCQKDCDERVDHLIKEKDDLLIKLNIVSEDLKKETNSKYLWTIVGAISGAGLGILIYEISK